MGVICPECGTQQPIVHNITADGLPPTKARDILARRLGCGHVLGSEKYDKYIEKVREIDIEANAKVQEIQDEAASRKAGLWKAMLGQGKVM